MIARFSRSYFITISILIIFICTVQLFRYPHRSETDSLLASQAWQGWLPNFSGNEGNGLIIDHSTPPPRPAKESAPGKAGDRSDQHPVQTNGQEKLLEKPTEKPADNDQTPAEKPAPTPTQVLEILASQKPAPSNFDATKENFDVGNPTFDPKGPRPDQIVILTATDGQGHNGGIKNIVENAMDNRKEFAAAHGYINHFINITKYNMGDAHPVWKKLPAIIETFQTYPDAEWVWWLDLDAIIMTPSIALEDKVFSHEAIKRNTLKKEQYVEHDRAPLHVYSPEHPDPAQIDMLIAQDHNGLNAGSFALRRSEWTRWLLDVWKDPVFVAMKSWMAREQDALLHLVTQHPQIRSHIGLVGQRVLNAYELTHDAMGWHKGDLVVHLAGCWVLDHCPRSWEQNWNKREKAPPPGTFANPEAKKAWEEKKVGQQGKKTEEGKEVKTES